MGASPQLGPAMRNTRPAMLLSLLIAVSWPASARSAERYAVIVSGASGGQPYAQKYEMWRTSLADTLVNAFRYPRDHVFVLGETEGAGVLSATRDNVRRLFSSLAPRLNRDDLLLVVLIGHGT